MSCRAVRRLAARLCAFLATASLCSLVAAQVRPFVSDRTITPGEWAVLPNWCYDTQGGPYGAPEGAEWLNKSPRAAHWVSKMGRDFWHLHHYCWALRDLHRLRRPDLSPRERSLLQERAISDIQYTIKYCEPTMPLMPEVLLRFGELHLMQNNPEAAQQAFQESRRLKPDYWPAYTRWADVLIGLKIWDQARAVLEEGLSHCPDCSPIKERLAAVAEAETAPSPRAGHARPRRGSE